MFTAFKIAIIIASIMWKINLESTYTEYFIRQTEVESAFITVNKAELHQERCIVLSCKATSCSNPTLLLHRTCSCASECGWRKSHHHYHTDHLTSNSWSLTPRGPLMLCSNHSLYPELTHAPVVLGASISLSPLTSNIVSPSLHLSWWPCTFFHWEIRGNQKKTYKTPQPPLLVYLHCLASCY